MNFSYPFIMRPVGTTLLAIGLLLVGIVAYRFLPVASMPTVELPTIRVSASRPGADPATMAATVAAPLERRLGDDRRRDRDHLGQSSLGSDHASSCSSTSSRNIDGAARDVQAALNAALTDLPSDLPSLPTFRKFNPAAAPVLILALTSKTRAAERDLRRRRHRRRAAHRAGRRRRRRDGERRRAAGRPRARQSRRARRRPASRSSEVRTAIAGANAQRPLGVIDGSDAGRDASAPTISCAARRRLPDAGGEEQRTATSCGCPTSPRVEQSTRNSRSAAWFNTPAVGAAHHHQAGRRQRHRDGRPASRALIPEIKRWIPAGIDISILSDRTGTIRASVARHAAHARRHHRAGDAGRVRVPAPRDADARGRHHGAAVARRHLRADVVRRLLDRQSLADGARGLGRLRGRRRHRHDRERVPQPGEGACAAARRASRARGRSASRSSRSASR